MSRLLGDLFLPLDQFPLNENEQKLGLFKHFNIIDQTQKRLKGFSLVI